MAAKIYSYKQHTDATTTYRINLPDGAIELATLGDTTFISLPEGSSLPTEQPAEIATTIALVVPDASLREALKAASPHCQLIAQRMIDQIRAAYSLDDEMYFARIGVGAATGMYTPTQSELQEMTVFGEFVEGVRQWGRGERAKFGL